MFVRPINLKVMMVIWLASKVWAADGGASLVVWSIEIGGVFRGHVRSCESCLDAVSGRNYQSTQHVVIPTETKCPPFPNSNPPFLSLVDNV